MLKGYRKQTKMLIFSFIMSDFISEIEEKNSISMDRLLYRLGLL